MIPPKYWSPTKKLMLLGAMAGGKLVEATATGNPLVFTTDLAKPLKSLLIPFTPKQSGTGDPSPENIRTILPWNGLSVWNGGANLFDGNYVTGLIQNTTESAWYRNTGTSAKSAIIPCRPNTQYTIHKIGYASSNRFSIGLTSEYPENNMPVTLVVEDSGQGEKQRTFTTGANDQFIIVYVSTGSEMAEPDMMVNFGSIALPYVPYHQITETDIVFPAMGKNLLNPAKYLFNTNTSRGLTFEVQSDGSVKVTGTTESSNFGPTLSARFQLPAGTYYGYRDDGDVYIAYRRATSESGGETTGLVSPFTLDGSEWVYCNIYIRNPGTFDTIIHPQIARENTQTAYEPFTNSVYGGEIEAVSGKLMDGWKAKTFDGSSDEVWYFVRVGTTDYYRAYINMPDAKQPNSVAVFADSYKAVSFDNRSFSSKVCFMGNENETPVIFALITDLTTLESFKAYLAENPLTIAYQLATPVEIQLTPTQLTALLGNNTIWSDSDGSMTAVYLKKG